MDTTSDSTKVQTKSSHGICNDVTHTASINDSDVVQGISLKGSDTNKVLEIAKECPMQSDAPGNDSTPDISEQDSVQSTLTDESKSTPVDRTQSKFEGDHAYELLDGAYYYNDTDTLLRYKYDDTSGEWISVESTCDSKSSEPSAAQSERDVHVDSEGRTYYYADNHYLCRYPTGHVYYMDEKNEWVLWDVDAATSMNKNDESGDQSCLGGEMNANVRASEDNSKWYYYRGKDAFYRDHSTNTVYKLNKDTNEWEAHKEKGVKRKKKPPPKGTEEEEFDTESSSEDAEEDQGEEGPDSGVAPPGYKNDPNISFDGESYIKKDKDEMLYEWDVSRRAWFPKLDENFMARYQMSYGFNPDGSKNENPVKYDDDEDDYEEELEQERKKKKEEEKKKKEKRPAGWFEADNINNTKVYVSHLPDNFTEQQFVDLMQKCGLVLKDPETGDYKVKLYKDDQGNFKGDALCTYIKVESVELALQILDGSCVGARSTERITVERAKFQMRGEYNAALKPKKKKKKLLEKIQKKQEKLFSWHPEPLRGQRGKHENVVIVRNAFEPSEFEDHAERILSHTETLRAQCSSFGTVKKLELFDRHSEGVVKVVFSDVEAADLCIASMDNRLYNKRKLTVSAWDGAQGFKVEETPEERTARLKKWNEFLMKGDHSTGSGDVSKAAGDTSKGTMEDTKAVKDASCETKMDTMVTEKYSKGPSEDPRDSGEVMETNEENSSKGNTKRSGDKDTDNSEQGKDKKLEGSEGGGGSEDTKPAT